MIEANFGGGVQHGNSSRMKSYVGDFQNCSQHLMSCHKAPIIDQLYQAAGSIQDEIRGGMNIKKPNFEHSEPQRIELRTHSNISFGPKTELRTSRTSPKTELFANFINKKWAQFFSKSSKPNFEHVRTCDFGQKPNFEPPEHHQKPNSSRTSNCSFHLYHLL